MNPHHCPLVTTDFNMVRRFFESLSLDELIFQTEQMFNQLSSSEKITYDICRYCSDYADFDGRIQFVEALFSYAVFSSVHVPLSYQRNPRLIDLVRTKKYEYYIPIAREQAQEAAALTDDIETAPTSSITVTNPRWNHADEQRKEASPTVAAVGDSVELLVDVKGYPEGAPVTFDIFDASEDPAMRIETVKGKNEGGTAKVSWTVIDPNEHGKNLKLEFEGSARSKSSGKAPIDVTTNVYRVELVDDEGTKLEGVKVVFTVAGESTEKVTDKEGIAEHPAKDPAVKADVQVFWDGKVQTTSTAATDTPVEDATTGETSEEPTDGFTVLLVDDQEKPLKDVEVSFKIAGGEPKSVVTDEQGQATLSAKDAAGAEEAEVSVLWKK